MTVFVWDSDLKELEIHENLDEDDEFIVERGTKPGKIAKQLQKQLAQKSDSGKQSRKKKIWDLSKWQTRVLVTSSSL